MKTKPPWNDHPVDSLSLECEAKGLFSFTAQPSFSESIFLITFKVKVSDPRILGFLRQSAEVYFAPVFRLAWLTFRVNGKEWYEFVVPCKDEFMARENLGLYGNGLYQAFLSATERALLTA